MPCLQALKQRKQICKPIRMVWSSASETGEESLEKVATFSRLIGKGEILETSKKELQNLAQAQVCLMLSVSLPQRKTQPANLAPNLDFVHQWLEMARI